MAHQERQDVAGADDVIKIFADDDPLVMDGTYDVYGWKPGERALIAKAFARRLARRTEAHVEHGVMAWPDRVEQWNARFVKYPPLVHSHGWTYGVWYTGKGFTKNQLHGQYPPTFLKRALALWPDVSERRILHVCAGTVTHGVCVDLSPRFSPSVLANAEQLPFRGGSFDVVLYDPPYDKANAKIYAVAPKPPRWNHVMLEMARVLTPGGHIGILHWYYPSYSRRKMGIRLVGLIAVCVGFCSMTRMFSIFEKVGEPVAGSREPLRVNGRFAEAQAPLFLDVTDDDQRRANRPVKNALESLGRKR